jgi:hypothetical protein
MKRMPWKLSSGFGRWNMEALRHCRRAANTIGITEAKECWVENVDMFPRIFIGTRIGYYTFLDEDGDIVWWRQPRCMALSEMESICFSTGATFTHLDWRGR